MIMKKGIIRHLSADSLRRRTPLVAVLALLAAPVVAQSPAIPVLDGLAKGAWTLRDREDGTILSVCLRTGRELIQLRHVQPGCSQAVVAEKPGEVTVQYTCPGNGYGRTVIRREGSDLVQIRSQGIHNGLPFSIEGEARRTGGC